MKYKKKISKHFEPDECSYKLWWMELYEKPKGADVAYWLLDEDGNYFGILRYRIHLLWTIFLIVTVLSLYFLYKHNTSWSVNVTCPKVLYLEDDLLAINVNNDAIEDQRVLYNVKYNGAVISTGVIQAGESVGTVKVNVSLSPGDYPATIVFITEGRLKATSEEISVLLKVK